MSENKGKNNIEKVKKKPDVTGNAMLACILAFVLIIFVQVAGTYLNLASFLKREISYPSLEAGIKGSIEQLSFSIDNQYEKDNVKLIQSYESKAPAAGSKPQSSQSSGSKPGNSGSGYSGSSSLPFILIT